MEAVHQDPFLEFALILALAATLGVIGLLLRQPLIIIFLVLGILVGPSVLNLVSTSDKINLLAELGIAILLFVVGLKLDLNLIRSMGKTSVMTGLGQVIFTSIVGYIIGILLGYSIITSLYIAVALTFSSTIIIVKLLSDKKEIDSLHGQIAIGFLIVQDLVVVFMMITLTTLHESSGDQLFYSLLSVTAKGLGIMVVLGLLMVYVIPGFVKYLAQSQELLVLFSIAWAIATAAASDYLGFGREVGAFLAGVSLASTQFRNVIAGRLTSIRDFLLLFFFIHLGMHLDLHLIGSQVAPAFIFSLFVLIGNPLIVMIIMGFMGYRKRTSFLAGLTVAQISEFSLIFAALGLTLGHIDQQTVGLITLVGLITIGLSTYMIIYSHQLYAFLADGLSIFERRIPYREKVADTQTKKQFDVILLGLGRFGSNIALTLKKEGYRLLGVDFDPKQVKFWKQQGISTQYGDIEDPELPDQIPLKETEVVVSSIADVQVNQSLLRMLKMHKFEGTIAVTAHKLSDMQVLKDENANIILLPFADAAETVSQKLFNPKKDQNSIK